MQPTRPPGQVSSAVGGTNRWVGLAKILVIDVAGPLLTYSLLKANGMSDVLALVLSGILPALGVLNDWVRHHSLGVIGVVVLSGFALGVVLAAATHNTRAVLLEGAVPTAVFAVACLASLRAQRPLIFRLAQAAMGGPTAEPGRRFDQRYQQQPGMRRYFRVVTIAWGVAYLVEAAVKIVVTQTTSTGFAFTVSRLLAYPVAAILVVWMIVYGKRAHLRGASQW